MEGKLQREGDVIHVIAERLIDLSPALAKVGEKGTFPVPYGPADAIRGGGGPDQRGLAKALGVRTKEDFNPDLLIHSKAGSSIAVRPRNFR